ncbi:MAG: phospho-sugar mutase [bacterium]
MNDDFMSRAKSWLSSDIDEDTRAEIKDLIDSGNISELEDRFYTDLKFGTGGMRGKMGAGTNRMNIYTVGIATQGFASYLLEKSSSTMNQGIVIAHDSRNNSTLFAKRTAEVMAANKIKTYIFNQITPTPLLSFSIRELGAAGGIVITASHNPPEYNGYKAYLDDGGQLVYPEDEKVLEKVARTSFMDVKTLDYEKAREEQLIEEVDEQVTEKYLNAILNALLDSELCKKSGSRVKIVYSPLHGAGYYLTPLALKEAGFTNLTVVPKQSQPDGNFPTVSYPNPEDPKAWELSIQQARQIDADLAIANDPDADRIGLMIKFPNGEYKLLNGNQTGALIVNHVLSNLAEKNNLPENPYIIKTIVTSELWKKIADNYQVDVIDVLTGFKYIGEIITKYQKEKEQGKSNRNYICGGEESFGYMIGDHVRDKDGINAALIIAEIAAFAKQQGISLYDKLQQIYETYGYHAEKLISFSFEGIEGKQRINSIMSKLRSEPPGQINQSPLKEKQDYLEKKITDQQGKQTGETTLPQSNVIALLFQDGTKITARPSGTEPKIKFYFFVSNPPGVGSQQQLEHKLKIIEQEYLNHLNLK